MADQALVEACSGNLERAIERSVTEFIKLNKFTFAGKTKAIQKASQREFEKALTGFMLSGVQLASNVLMIEDGLVNPHTLSEAVKMVCAKHRMSVVPVPGKS